MPRYAVVKDGKVVNVVLWDEGPGWAPPAGAEAVPVPDGVRAGKGWSYTPGSVGFRPPVDDIPRVDPRTVTTPTTDLVAALQSAQTVDQLKQALLAFFRPKADRSREVAAIRARGAAVQARRSAQG